MDLESKNDLERSDVSVEIPTQLPAPGADLVDVLKSLLAPLNTRLTELEKDNRAANEENQRLREELNTIAANPIPQHLQGDDFPANPNAARSVVIATRPVTDNPEKYNRKSIVDAGRLSTNDASPMSGKNRE